ncbi:hypothetical protein ACQP2F_31050 [Actinoplanes sp. CA-030573]|uniref:hypothetical protein n=1 Tax=Actinoplanes sp. CA-030573 TaxID=3239898 RepID=UPI003D8EEB55
MTTTLGSPPTEAPKRARSVPQTVGGVIAALVALASIGVTLRAQLNGDVTYALGGIETAGKGGVSIWDVFIARPVVYKLLIGWMDDFRALFVADERVVVQQTLLRAEAWVLIAGVVAVLYFGVRRFLGAAAATGIAVATGLALVVAPPWHFLEPDWVAALAGVLAVGAACAPRRDWLGGVLGGVAACLVVAVKLATFPVALLALLIVAVLGRRRAIWASGMTALAVAVWYVLTKQLLPWEWIWLADQAALVQDSPIHHGIRWEDIHHLLIGVANVAILSPVVVLAPAAAVVLVRRAPSGRGRWIGAGVAVVAAGLSVASAYGQGEFYMYHFAIVPILAAGVWGAAYALVPAARLPLAIMTLLVAVSCYLLLRRPAGWRLAHADETAIVIGLVAVVAALVLAGLGSGRRRVPAAPWAVGLVALCAALVPASMPGAPYAFSSYDYAIYNSGWNGHAFADLSRRLGRDTPVLYLTFGSVNQAMGNPTSCRYPSPQWLQRGAGILEVRTYRSYADNLKCLTGDQDAKYLVWQPKWFNIGRSSPEVRALIARRFNCDPSARLPAPRDYVVCPARG